MKVKIDKRVPLPRLSNKYHFDKLEKVGWSFLIENAKQEDTAKVRSAAYLYGKKNGCKFTVRHTEEGIRVWRIENDN